MKVKSHGVSVSGSAHPKEDEILLNNSKHLYAVADGVTHSSVGSGGVASQLAVYFVNKIFEHDLKETFEELNKEICRLRLEDKTIGETTLTVAHISDSKVEIANVGDSPAFVIKNNAITKMTKDDSLTFGLTQVIGMPGLSVHLHEEKIGRGDYVILATDGITSVMRAQEMLRIATGLTRPKEICEAILREVDSKPKDYDDDKSIIVLKILLDKY